MGSSEALRSHVGNRTSMQRYHTGAAFYIPPDKQLKLWHLLYREGGDDAGLNKHYHGLHFG